MANTDAPNGFLLVKSLTGQMAPERLPVAASQIIATGDALIISSGLLQIALSNSGQVFGVAAAPIVTGGSVTRADTLSFYPATEHNLFEAQTSGSSTAGLVGTDVDIEGATGVMEINENATTEKVFRVLELRSDVDSTLDIGLNDRVRGIFVRSSYTNSRDALA